MQMTKKQRQKEERTINLVKDTMATYESNAAANIFMAKLASIIFFSLTCKNVDDIVKKYGETSYYFLEDFANGHVLGL